MTRLRILCRLRALFRSRQMDRDIDDQIASHLAEATEEYIQQGLSPEDACWAAQRSFGGVTQAREVYRQVYAFMWLNDFRQDLRYTVRTLLKRPVSAGGETQLVGGIWADGGFFETLGVQAVLGRTFSRRDDQPGGGPDGPVAVMSYGYWQRQYGGVVDVIGRSIRLSGVPFTIVGVTPPDFFGIEVGRSFDFIVPLDTEALIRGDESARDSATANFLSILARLKPAESLEAAAAELRGFQPAIREATIGPWSQDVRDRYLTSPFTLVSAATGYSNLRSRYEQPVFIIAVIVGLVLLIGCVSVANLLLARATGRRHELSLRRALGASRGRLVRQLFAESLSLATAGAALGVLIAAYSSSFLVQQLATPASPVSLDVSIDGRVLAFTVVVTVLIALLFGTAPAYRATRVAPIDALKGQGRAAIDQQRGGMMGWLVTVQVALSLVLVAAAGLFIQSFAFLANRPLGIEPGGVLVSALDTQQAMVAPADRVALYGRVREAVVGLPNVAAAAISEQTPVGGGGFTPAVGIASVASTGQVVPADRDVYGNLVSPGWFSTFGTRLIAGRDFNDGDRRGAPRVVIVNGTFARRFFDGGSPLGRTITVYPNTPRAMSAQIVGVAEDAVYGSPREPMRATWYLPVAQFGFPDYPFDSARLSVRARAGSPELLTKAVAAAVADVNPQLELTFRPLTGQIDASLARERLMAQVAGFLGGLALLLAALGLYGVTAYAIACRRAEMAIRIALGGAPTAVTALVLRRVALLVGVGLLAGTAIGASAEKFVGGLLYGLPPRDPTTFVGAAVLLAVTGTLAVWFPARRASRTNPLDVLGES